MQFKNNKIELPKFTMHFEKMLEELDFLNIDLELAKVGRTTVLKKCYEFLAELLTENKLLEILNSNSFEEIDTKELELLFYLIRMEYQRPLEEAITNHQQEQLNSVLNNHTVSEILKIAQATNGKKQC